MYTLTKWVNYIPTKVHTLKLFQASSKIKLCSICKVYPTSCGSICIHHFCQSLLSSFCYKETDLTLMISHVISISTVNYENNLIDFTQRLIYNYQLYWNLKTIMFVMNQSVARKLQHRVAPPNTPPLTVWPNGEWADSTCKRTDLKIWTVAVDHGPCSRVRCTHPICIQRNMARERCLGISVL